MSKYIPPALRPASALAVASVLATLASPAGAVPILESDANLPGLGFVGLGLMARRRRAA